MKQYHCAHCTRMIAQHHIDEREFKLEGCESVTVTMNSLYCTHCGKYSFVEKEDNAT